MSLYERFLFLFLYIVRESCSKICFYFLRFQYYVIVSDLSKKEFALMFSERLILKSLSSLNYRYCCVLIVYVAPVLLLVFTAVYGLMGPRLSCAMDAV